MGNQQSNAGAAQFFGGVTDILTSPINQATNLLVGKSIIPSASAAIAASSDPNVNPNASSLAKTEMGKISESPGIGIGKIGSVGTTGGIGTIGAAISNISKPPPNMICAKAVGQDKATLNADTNVWYCGTGNDADRVARQRKQFVGAAGGIIGNKPTPGPTDAWTGGGALTNNPPGTGYSPNIGPQQNWQARPGDGVTPPGSRPPNMPYGQAPMSDDPMQLNPQFNLSGSMDPGNKTVLGGDANSLSVHQGFPNLNASPALPPKAAASVPAMDTTTLVMIGGAVVVGAVLLAKKKVR